MRTDRLLISICLLSGGCTQTGAIDVDLSSTPVRFVVHHRGWPRPFWWPRVTEFAVASDETEAGASVWYLKSTAAAGRPAHHLAIVYGRVPPGFYQAYPENDVPPEPLRADRVYYVAAGGEHVVYRMAFSLPVHADDFGPAEGLGGP